MRGIIFNSTHRNLDFKNQESYSYLHLTDRLVCSSEFESKSWKNKNEYIHGTSEASMSNWEVGFEGPELEINAGFEKGPIAASVSITVPPNSYSYGEENTDSNSDIEYFFENEGGSISRSSVHCSIYDVLLDIKESSLTLTTSFIDSIKSIDKAKTIMEMENAMKKFIQLFGTHYSKQTVMGMGVEFETRDLPHIMSPPWRGILLNNGI